MALKQNFVTYTLPSGQDAIGNSGVVANGTFTVVYTYNNDNSFKSVAIASSNITTSGGVGSNNVYNNTFNEDFNNNKFDDLSVKTTGNGDHIGAKIAFDPNTGQLKLTFQELQENTITGLGSGSDFNQLSLTFTDTAAKSPIDADRYDVDRIITIDNITEDYQIDGGKNGPQALSSIVDNGGSDDTLTAACYCKGTLILTANGEVAVEDLSVGDQVMTVSGALEPVIWLGNSTIHCERQLHKDKAYPIRIVKDALGINLPKRDLFLSPDHSVYIDGVMIPAYCLINGSTITQAMTETLVTYYHVELPQHNAILAEGLPAESYLETSEANRNFFKAGTAANLANVTKLDIQYPACPEDTPAWKHIWDTQGYAPLTQSGPILEAVQAKLAVRAQELTVKLESKVQLQAA